LIIATKKCLQGTQGAGKHALIIKFWKTYLNILSLFWKPIEPPMTP